MTQRQEPTALKIGTVSTITLSDQPLLTNFNPIPPNAEAPLASPVMLTASGVVLTVGPGQAYATIAAAVQAAPDGATIDVQAGTYTNDFVTIDKNLTLQAVGGYVTMVETSEPPDGKAMIDEGGSGISVTINGFNIGGVTVPDGNGAAIRYEGGTLTLNDDYFHNNQDGMLAASDPSGSISINNCEFAYNGAGDGYTHNLYVNDIANLTITNSYFHDANVGHEIKSRAENTTITGTRIFDNNSTASYSIDLPNGGNATIENNTIEKGPNAENQTMIRYGEEGNLHSGSDVLIADNTIINDRYTATVVGNATSTPLAFQNNQLWGLTSAQIGGPVTESNTTYLATRPTLDSTPIQAPCFAAGTRILTTRGEVAVEALTEDDRVVTPTGETLRVRWIGYRRIEPARHKQPDLVAPVRIRRDAVAPGQPRRDLHVSPDHCLFVAGRLVPAKLLINDMTIVLERHRKTVTYHHVELERHAILLAEGLPAESYLDTGNRALFANAGVALVLHPEFQINAGLKHWTTDACAPLTVDPGLVEPIWQQLAARAATFGFVPPQHKTTSDAGLRVVARCGTIRPLANDSRRYLFVLPPNIGAVRLVSRASVPSHLRPWIDDWRRLGVSVRRIAVRGSGTRRDIAPDDPALTQGWHATEDDGATLWRWTDGDAVLQLQDRAGPAILEIEVAIPLTYCMADEPGRTNRATRRVAATAAMTDGIRRLA